MSSELGCTGMCVRHVLVKVSVPRLYGVTFLSCSVEAGVFSYEHCMMYDIQLYRPCGFNQGDLFEGQPWLGASAEHK